MSAIFGIGNPGKRYENTRHNIGFILLDRLASKFNLKFTPSKKDYYIAGGIANASPFFLIKPTTYVNLCGLAAKDFFGNVNIGVEDFLVVYDDINLELGKIRIRKSGGDGGHNGIHSIIYHLEDESFPRLRFGIGNNFAEGEMAQYVLSKFNKETFEQIEASLDFAVDLIENFITGGTKLMLDYFSKHSSNKNESTNTEKGT